MKKTRSAIRIPMPLRYLINLVLILALWFVLYTLIQNGTITNYWSGILITVGINIILATSLNVATGYLGQLPLGHRRHLRPAGGEKGNGGGVHRLPGIDHRRLTQRAAGGAGIQLHAAVDAV